MSEQTNGMNGSNGNKVNMDTTDLDREVIRCKTCGLVQYRTRMGNCRRCLRLLPPKVEFLIPPPEPQELPGDDRQLFEKWPNRETVENIGQRIRQLRESRGMTQSQLQARSRVSRSYLSRIESGQMTPSLGTLEKISEALGVGLNRFFVPETNGEALLEDPFIQGSAAVPSAARLGTVAIDSEAPGRDQRPRLERQWASASASTTPVVPHGATGASDAPGCDGPPLAGQEEILTGLGSACLS